MRIDIISAVPELLESPLNYSIVKRAREKGLVEVHVHNLREYTTNKHRRVDDYAFGFGAGMVLQIEPIDCIISKLKSERTYDEVIILLLMVRNSTRKWRINCLCQVILLSFADITKALITAFVSI